MTIHIKKIPRVDIAITQLKQACRLFNEDDFISSLTLAGAAEEILGSILNQECKSIKNALTENAQIHLAMREAQNNPTDKKENEIKYMLNYARNASKHLTKSQQGNDEEKESFVCFDQKYEAESMLNRAITNLVKLENLINNDIKLAKLYAPDLLSARNFVPNIGLCMVPDIVNETLQRILHSERCGRASIPFAHFRGSD